MAEKVEPEPAARLRDPAVRGQLHQVSGLVLVEVVPFDKTQLHRRRGDALFEVEGVEAKAVAEELDDVIVARRVARLWHEERITMAKVVTRERESGGNFG